MLCSPLELVTVIEPSPSRNGSYALPEGGAAILSCMLDALAAGTPGRLRMSRRGYLGPDTTEIDILQERNAVFVIDVSNDGGATHREIARKLHDASYFEQTPRDADALFEYLTAGYASEGCIGAPVCNTGG